MKERGRGGEGRGNESTSGCVNEMTGASQKACSGPRVLGGMHRGGRSHTGGQGLEEDVRSRCGTQRA